MRKPRNRTDGVDTLYRVSNTVAGRPGELVLGKLDLDKLKRTVRKLAKLYVVDVVSLRLYANGYELLLAAPAGLPDALTVATHFRARFGPHRPLPDLGDLGTLRHWAERLRNISCLVKDLEQIFTQWYNRVRADGVRRGTVWQGRFRSAIVTVARAVLSALGSYYGRGRSALVTPEQGRWIARTWRAFASRHPDAAVTLTDAGDGLRELSTFMLRCALHPRLLDPRHPVL